MKLPNRSATTFGFSSGRELLFNSSPLIHSKQSKVHYGINNSLVLRKPLSTHFKAEAAINYKTFPGNNLNNDTRGNNTVIITKSYQLALPATMNYFFLPEHCKVRPYLGAGVQCSLNLLHPKSNSLSPFSGETNENEPATQSPGTKYISILFTQGVTYQVNTKIELCQSFHFIPDNTNKTIGIDLGIGYRLP